MPETDVTRRTILDDIRAGLDNSALKRKHRLSSEGLQSIFDDLVAAGALEMVDNEYVIPAVRRLSAGNIVNDIRAGMNNAELMEKYALTPKQLKTTFDILVGSNAVNREEIRDDLSLTPDEHVREDQREMERYFIDFELPIVEIGPPEIDGKVRDITEKGVGTIGIPSRIDDIKKFLVLHDEFVLIEPFMFEAQCRWVRDDADGEHYAGYEIIGIDEKDLRDLRQLIHLVTFYG
ncbi:MAG: PilZ domain-containing protein [Desulfomonilaceae bacterium]|nr:PilZ domain-containing protein [Desulfomonilaceae bacterium]